MGTDPLDTGGDQVNRYRTGAVTRALELLSLFASGRKRWTLAAIAEAADLPKPTALRLLGALESARFVRRVDDEWALGFMCFVLGNVIRDDLDVRSEAVPHLVDLRDRTGETTQIAVLEDWQVVYLERVQSLQAVAYMTSRAGAILPPHCTGLGKAMMAFLDPDDVRAWLATADLGAHSPHTLTDPEALMTDLAEVRARGYALDLGEREEGVHCIAAPVRDHSAEVVAALSVAGPAMRMPDPLEGSEMARHVVEVAAALSERLGYLGDEYTGVLESLEEPHQRGRSQR